MKTLKFNFTHPFKGNVIIKMLGNAGTCCRQFLLDCKESADVVIPLDNLQTGKYQLTLDWELDQQYFVLREEFEITGTSDLLSPAG